MSSRIYLYARSCNCVPERLLLSLQSISGKRGHNWTHTMCSGYLLGLVWPRWVQNLPLRLLLPRCRLGEPVNLSWGLALLGHRVVQHQLTKGVSRRLLLSYRLSNSVSFQSVWLWKHESLSKRVLLPQGFARLQIYIRKLHDALILQGRFYLRSKHLLPATRESVGSDELVRDSTMLAWVLLLERAKCKLSAWI